MTIPEYLAAVRRELPADPLYRRRVLAEVEDHLRESAAAVGEEEAVARMGAPAAVARGLAPAAAASASAWAACVVAVATMGFAAAYVVSENALPPAPWPSAEAAPAFLRWTTTGATWSFLLALAAELVALALLPLRRSAALAVSCVCAVSIALACSLAVAAGIQRASLYEQLGVTGRLSPLETAIGVLYLLGLAVGAVGAAVWASRVWLTAHRASRS